MEFLGIYQANSSVYSAGCGRPQYNSSVVSRVGNHRELSSREQPAIDIQDIIKSFSNTEQLYASCEPRLPSSPALETNTGAGYWRPLVSRWRPGLHSPIRQRLYRHLLEATGLDSGVHNNLSNWARTTALQQEANFLQETHCTQDTLAKYGVIRCQFNIHDYFNCPLTTLVTMADR